MFVLRYTTEEREIEKAISQGIIEGDEHLLKSSMIRLMNLFLKNKSSVPILDSIASLHITLPITQKSEDDFDFQDKRLGEVFTELSALDQYTKPDARKIVRRLLKKLEINTKQRNKKK